MGFYNTVNTFLDQSAYQERDIILYQAERIAWTNYIFIPLIGYSSDLPEIVREET